MVVGKDKVVGMGKVAALVWLQVFAQSLVFGIHMAAGMDKVHYSFADIHRVVGKDSL